ncbi:hypothetical protein P8452_17962 [Trifolium repens]|nr:hypothetical protein P8452_17962 [Trifolium repens]
MPPLRSVHTPSIACIRPLRDRQKHRPTAHTYDHHFSLSLSPQFSLTRGKKFNGILERETRERKGLVQLLPKPRCFDCQ